MNPEPSPLPENASQRLANGQAASQRITFLSPAQPVNMEPRWFELANLNHFWIRRRFEVLLRIGRGFLRPDWQFLEIGCGHGLLQRQLQTSAGVAVDGFDLYLPALQLNKAESGKLYYYNIFDRAPQFEGRYDVIFLFDVLEHVTDDVGFLKECLFYLKPGGRLIVNVPARMELFSKHDTMVGHVRRYTLRTLRRCALSSDLNLEAITYWGLPFYPILLMRKLLLAITKDRSSFDVGFAPPGELANQVLALLSKLEFIPQRFIGTSILSVLQKPCK